MRPKITEVTQKEAVNCRVEYAPRSGFFHASIRDNYCENYINGIAGEVHIRIRDLLIQRFHAEFDAQLWPDGFIR